MLKVQRQNVRLPRGLCPDFHQKSTILAYVLEVTVIQEEWLVGDDPLYQKLCAKLTQFEQNAGFQSIFARSASDVASSEKSSIHW